MFKTLACLAAAMTGTSALLGRINPVQTLPADPARAASDSSDDLPNLARAVVQEAGTIRRGQWLAVEVLAGPAATSGATLLAARSESETYHFRVDARGRPSSTSAWLSQRVSSKHPTYVAIHVERRADAQRMSPAQWQSVRALVTAVSDAASRDGALLPVRLHSPWDDNDSSLPGPMPQTAPLHPSARPGT